MKRKALLLFPILFFFFACSSDNEKAPEKEILKDVTYEVLLFEYISDTGNNSSRFHYEIKYTNPNNVAIKGVSNITINSDGLILTPIKRVPPYIEIGANSTFTEVYNVEEPHNINIGIIKSIKFVSLKFNIVED